MIVIKVERQLRGCPEPSPRRIGRAGIVLPRKELRREIASFNDLLQPPLAHESTPDRHQPLPRYAGGCEDPRSSLVERSRCECLLRIEKHPGDSSHRCTV